MRIAIAEADGTVGRILREGQGNRGDEVIEVHTQTKILDLLTQKDIHVLILDWTLPAFSGPDVCRQIRLRDLTQPYVFMIALMPRDELDQQFKAYGVGVDAVVPQPCDPDEIAARLNVARRISSHEEALRDRSAALERIRLDLEMENATLSEIASCDALTGLRNRRYFGEVLDSQFSLARRKGLPMSLVMIDVDQFKPFNDHFGHPAGDDVLRVVGSLLRGCVRDHDTVARYGGEEFAILLPATEQAECIPLVDRLRLTIANHSWLLRPVTISLGVATLTPNEGQPSDLIDQADRSLYYSKAMGRNRTTHARELPDMTGNAIADRLGKSPLFSASVSDHAFPITGNTSFPNS